MGDDGGESPGGGNSGFSSYGDSSGKGGDDAFDPSNDEGKPIGVLLGGIELANMGRVGRVASKLKVVQKANSLIKPATVSLYRRFVLQIMGECFLLAASCMHHCTNVLRPYPSELLTTALSYLATMAVLNVVKGENKSALTSREYKTACGAEDDDVEGLHPCSSLELGKMWGFAIGVSMAACCVAYYAQGLKSHLLQKETNTGRDNGKSAYIEKVMDLFTYSMSYLVAQSFHFSLRASMPVETNSEQWGYVFSVMFLCVGVVMVAEEGPRRILSYFGDKYYNEEIAEKIAAVATLVNAAFAFTIAMGWYEASRDMLLESLGDDTDPAVSALAWFVFLIFAAIFLVSFSVRAYIQSRSNRRQHQRLREQEGEADAQLGDGKDGALDPAVAFANKEAQSDKPKDSVGSSTRVMSLQEIMKQRQADLKKLHAHTTKGISQILVRMRTMTEGAWALLAAIQFRYALRKTVVPTTHADLLGFAVLVTIIAAVCTLLGERALAKKRDKLAKSIEEQANAAEEARKNDLEAKEKVKKLRWNEHQLLRKETLSNLGSSVGSGISTVGSAVGGGVTAVGSGVGSGISTVGSAVGGAVKGGISGLRKSITSPRATLSSSAKAMGKGAAHIRRKSTEFATSNPLHAVEKGKNAMLSVAGAGGGALTAVTGAVGNKSKLALEKSKSATALALNTSVAAARRSSRLANSSMRNMLSSIEAQEFQYSIYSQLQLLVVKCYSLNLGLAWHDFLMSYVENGADSHMLTFMALR
jgi:hypothetical protein